MELLEGSVPSTMQDAVNVINRARTSDSLRTLYSTRYDERDQDWRQEILYFLLPDRFNDGKSRSKLERKAIRELRTVGTPSMVSYDTWAESGKRWQGGTIAGIAAQIPYLKKLGATAVWIAPLLRQREHSDAYHGYAIQHFLDIDPRFGTLQDLVALVEKAHTAGLRVILDIIINHTGHNWDYCCDGGNTDCCPWYKQWPNYYGNPNDAAMRSWGIRWRTEKEDATLEASGPFGPLDGVYPPELRDRSFYSCAGGDCTKSDTSEANPFSNHEQHHRGDFPGSYRDIATDKPEVISQLATIFKYWIALTNVDGFRIDTLKHMGVEEARSFCGAIKAFAAELGKPHFFVIGEIAGGDKVRDAYLDVAFGEDGQSLGDVPLVALARRNLDAALDIGDNRPLLGKIGRGEVPLQEYLNSFKWRAHEFSGHRYEGNRHVSILDDHDHVNGVKLRFSSFVNEDAAAKDHLVAVPTAIQLFTLGIPCIYYGSEQAFAGPPKKDVAYVTGHSWGGSEYWADRYLREAMFGPEHPRAAHDKDFSTQVSSLDAAHPGFGPFGTCGVHCFDDESPAFVRIAALCALREKITALRVGDMYGRKVQPRIPGSTAADNLGYGFYADAHLQAWSRILGWTEVLVVVNPNAYDPRSGDVEVGWQLCPPGTDLKVLLNTAEIWAKAAGAPPPALTAGKTVKVYGEFDARNPPHVWIEALPPGEVLVLIKE